MVSRVQALTQRDVALRARVSIRALRDLEHDRVRRPHPRALRALASVLGLSSVELEQVQSALTDGRTRGRDGQLDVGVLGTLSVRCGSSPLDIGPLKQRLLLGLLAIQPGRWVSADEIVDVLWQAGHR